MAQNNSVVFCSIGILTKNEDGCRQTASNFDNNNNRLLIQLITRGAHNMTLKCAAHVSKKKKKFKCSAPQHVLLAWSCRSFQD